MSTMIMKASRVDSESIKQTVVDIDDDKPNRRQLNHFSHRHPLQLSQQQQATVCSGCEHEISGPAYICTKPKCEFVLHDICFDLPRSLRHGSHPNHPLFLLHSPPANTEKGSTSCGACGDSMDAFTYHCETCRFSLHVECASLPDFEIRRDHMHPLMLLWDVPAADMTCYVCLDDVDNGCWMYSCLACNCGVHLDCIAANP